MPTYTSHYPTAHNSTYVKATTEYSGSFYAFYATDPAKSLTGTSVGNQWYSADSNPTNQKINIDLGEALAIRRLYIENGHNSGANTNLGIKGVSVYGTNSGTAFANTTYADTTDLTLLGTIEVAQHVASDISDPQYFTFNNFDTYRYIVLRIADNWLGTDYQALRRVVCQTEDLVLNLEHVFEAPTSELISEVSNPLLIHGDFDVPVAELVSEVSNPLLIQVNFEAPVTEISISLRQEIWLATVSPLPILYSVVMPTKLVGVDFQAPRPEMDISPGTDVVFESPVAEMAVGVSNPIRLDVGFESPVPEMAGTLTAVGVMSMAFVAPRPAFDSSIFQNAVFDVAMTGYLPEMNAVLHKTAILDVAMEIPHPVVSIGMSDQTTEETVKYDRYYRCSL